MSQLENETNQCKRFRFATHFGYCSKEYLGSAMPLVFGRKSRKAMFENQNKLLCMALQLHGVSFRSLGHRDLIFS